MSEYLDLCYQPKPYDLYSVVSDELNRYSPRKRKPWTRESTKSQIQTYLYDNHYDARPVCRVFAQRFPTVNKYVLRYKREHGKKKFARLMQREEAYFIFKQCAERILSDYPHVWFATIHDNVVTLRRWKSIIKTVMEEELAAIGARGRIRAEPL